MSDTAAEAWEQGKILLSKIKGTGWKIRIWENFGWHYAVENPPISISEGTDGYMILMTDRPNEAGPGSCLWTLSDDDLCSNDPVQLIKRQAREARKRINPILQAVERAEEIARANRR